MEVVSMAYFLSSNMNKSCGLNDPVSAENSF